MDILSIINLIIEKGLTVILSAFWVYILFNVIKKSPEWIPKIFDLAKQFVNALDNSNTIQKEVTEVFKDTKLMHEVMDEKMDNQHKEIDLKMDAILEQIESLSKIIEINEKADEDFKKVIMKEINKLKEEFEELKKGGENN